MQNPEDNWAQDPDEQNHPHETGDRDWPAQDPYGPAPAWRPYEGPQWPQDPPWPHEPWRRD